MREVRIYEETGTAEVILPDFQLSLAIGKEGQNARLAHRLTGWRIDIKSETQLAEEAAGIQDYGTEEWAEGEWILNEETGEQVWQPADGSDAISAEEWASSPVIEVDDAPPAEKADAEESDAEADAAEESDAEADAVAEPELPADESDTSEEE